MCLAFSLSGGGVVSLAAVSSPPPPPQFHREAAEERSTGVGGHPQRGCEAEGEASSQRRGEARLGPRGGLAGPRGTGKEETNDDDEKRDIATTDTPGVKWIGSYEHTSESGRTGPRCRAETESERERGVTREPRETSTRELTRGRDADAGRCLWTTGERESVFWWDKRTRLVQSPTVGEIREFKTGGGVGWKGGAIKEKLKPARGTDFGRTIIHREFANAVSRGRSELVGVAPIEGTGGWSVTR